MQGEAQTVVSKPPVGAVLNPQHSLASGLIVCPLINEGSGNSLWDSGTKQVFTMDNPLVWVNLPGTAQYPWAGSALQFNGTPGTTMGPGCRIPVGSIPFFQQEPNGTTGITVAYLWSPTTGVAQSVRRIGDTDKTSVYTIYESISGQANKWTYTYRDKNNTVQLKHFPYTVGDWIFSVVCIKDGECKIYINGVLSSTSTDANFHNSWWQGNTILPVWWHMTEGVYFTGYPAKQYVVFDGKIAGAWMWNRYLSQADVTSLYNNPWGMFSGPPSVTANPVSQTGTSGATVNFTAAATANIAPTVQWQVSQTGTAGTFSNIDSVANPTAATGTLILANITPSQNGYAYQAVFTNAAGSGTTTAATLTVQRTFAWFQGNYGLTNPDPTTDPYHTGVCQLAAYAFGVNPAVPDRSQLPQAGLQNNFLQISYPRWKDAADLTYVVEVSGDLKTWNSGPGYTQQVSVTPIDATREQVIEQDLIPTTSAPSRFIHVKITH